MRPIIPTAPTETPTMIRPTLIRMASILFARVGALCLTEYLAATVRRVKRPVDRIFIPCKNAGERWVAVEPQGDAGSSRATSTTREAAHAGYSGKRRAVTRRRPIFAPDLERATARMCVFLQALEGKNPVRVYCLCICRTHSQYTKFPAKLLCV